MDHESICNCQFREHCETFIDPLIDKARKGPTGLGCREQNDLYRAKHCHTFSCAYLSLVLSDALRQPVPQPVQKK